MSETHRDDIGAKLGLWLFLFTEVLLFGGMFLLYAAYRYAHPDDFKNAAHMLDASMGTINTIILLTSSLTVVLSIVALQRHSKKLSIFFLIATILMGIAFLVNKYFEWGAKIKHGIYPKGPELANMPEGESLYFGLYYAMTGLHGLHIVIGLIILIFMLVFIIRDKITPDNMVKLENGGLYWHLVDIIWIFLFPLFYLIH